MIAPPCRVRDSHRRLEGTRRCINIRCRSPGVSQGLRRLSLFDIRLLHAAHGRFLGQSELRYAIRYALQSDQFSVVARTNRTLRSVKRPAYCFVDDPKMLCRNIELKATVRVKRRKQNCGSSEYADSGSRGTRNGGVASAFGAYAFKLNSWKTIDGVSTVTPELVTPGRALSGVPIAEGHAVRSSRRVAQSGR
jgi:hypothetical protein